MGGTRLGNRSARGWEIKVSCIGGWQVLKNLLFLGHVVAPGTGPRRPLPVVDQWQGLLHVTMI